MHGIKRFKYMNWYYDIYLYLRLALLIFTSCLKGEERGWKINIIFSIKYETSPKMCSSEKFAELKIVQLIVNATGIVIYRSYYLDRPLSKEPQPAAGRCIFNQTARVEGCYEFFANVDHEVAQRLSFFFPCLSRTMRLCVNLRIFFLARFREEDCCTLLE